MSTDKLDALNILEESLQQHSSSHSIVLRLRKLLISCSESIGAGDFRQSENSISELTEFLNSVSDDITSESDNEACQNQAFEVVVEIRRYITSPSLDQAVIDGLSFELPKAVARFACVSQRCMEIAESVIDRFIEACSPRDMVTILCEALDSPSRMFDAPCYFAPLLTGLAKVFVSIQRRHFELMKEATPVILNVLKVVASETDDEDTDFVNLFNKSIDIADSIEAVCVKLDGKVTEKLHALLGLFLLQIMALASITVGFRASTCLPLVLRLSESLPHCSLSYSGLITGKDVDILTSTIVGDDEDGYRDCFSHVKHGGALAVIWGHMFDDVALAAKENLIGVKYELRSSQTKRWQAAGMLKHILSCIKLSWELKKHAIDFLLCILDGDVVHQLSNEQMDGAVFMPSLFAALQAVEMVIMHAPDVVLRRKAFDALKRLLADVPSSMRFEILQALIQNSDSSSMIAILLDCVRKEMQTEICRSTGNEGTSQGEDEAHRSTIFWSANVIELVELVLRPPKGGPPSLPEYGDAVLAALNLYRFVLLTESTRKTNFTGILSKNNLQMAYNNWLLPLRTLVTGIMVENQKDHDQLAVDIVCGLNPVELVLYRCIELVEEKLKFST